MKPEEILKLVEAIHAEKGIDRELIFESIEVALSKAAGKKLMDIEADPIVVINRETGDVTFYDVELEELEEETYNEETGELETVLRKIRKVREDEDAIIPIDPSALGRVAAQTAKQVIIQRLREAERDTIFDEYVERRRTIVTGAVQRMEGPNLIVNLDNRVEGFFPKWEQVRDEHYEIGERVKALILDVKKSGQKVKIILSRTHPDFVRRLFEEDVPEIKSHFIEVKALVREPGYRSKVAVASFDPKIDAVGACVGVRGMRIKGIIEELGGEKIDIIRWNDSAEVLIQNALKPATVASITLDYDATRARVVVPDDQLSLAIGKGGQNVRLASRLSGWDIDIMSHTQERMLQYKAMAKFETIPDVTREMAEKLFEAGYTKFDEILEAGPERLQMTVEDLPMAQAEQICDWLENVDEDEYYREVEIELPSEEEVATTTRELKSLFADDEEAAAGEAAEGAEAAGEDGAAKKPAKAAARKDGGLDTLFAEAEEAPDGSSFTKEWVEGWIARLPESVRETLSGATALLKEKHSAGDGLVPGDWNVLVRVKGLDEGTLKALLDRLEDDGDRRTALVDAAKEALQAAAEDNVDDVTKAMHKLTEHTGISIGLASLLPALTNPQRFPLVDWTSLTLCLTDKDPSDTPNPQLLEQPAVHFALRAVKGWPIALPARLSALTTELSKVEHYREMVTAVRAMQELNEEAKQITALDISLAMWAIGLSALTRDTDLDAWGFTAGGEQAEPERLLGFDPHLSADVEAS